MKDEIKVGRGGARAGAGRKPTGSKIYSFRADAKMAGALDEIPNRTAFIKRSISRSLEERPRAPRGATPATALRPLRVPSFEVRLVAGFPVPLDNDEKSQDIDMLRLLCPHPESSYLIRVQGESMIDAGVESGDIVIVDKSRRNPSSHDIAVCELNGEYTLKRVSSENGQTFLVPANPEFPRIAINPEDSFCVWGIVTYIIHKARD